VRTLRIVSYAVNGSGVGHLVRLIAINRWIRRYAQHAGVRAEIWFLTSSEADGLLLDEKFASFKLPSKTVVGEAGIDKLAYLALAKQWVWHSLGLLRPELFIVDSFPRGSFGELLSALDLAKQRAFVYRPMKAELAERADFQAMLPLYDAIVVPEDEGVAPIWVPDTVRSRVRHTGPILVRERSELLERAAARRQLGIPDDAQAVLVTAGGGGDPGSERHLTQVLDALPDGVHAVVAPGPLYRGAQRHGPRISWVAHGAAVEWLSAIDLAVCAAGYNTWNELMFVGVPALFLPQAKIADEQDVRARRAETAGAAWVGGVERIVPLLAELRDPTVREARTAAARSLAPRNGARRAAAELLRLVLPASEVEAAEEAIGDDALTTARQLGVPLATMIDVIQLLEDGGRRHEEPGEVAALATTLLREAAGHGLPLPVAMRLWSTLARKLPRARAGERAEALRQVIAALAPFGDWAGAATLVKLVVAEKQLPAAAFAAEMGGFLGRLRERNASLYAGVELLSRAQLSGGELSSNLELLRLAGAS
jgi:predicted glycosyltransferase